MELIKRALSGWAALPTAVQQREEVLDVIVPDVSPDVFTVLSVTASCALQETVLQPGRAELCGSAEVLVLYTSEEERVHTLRATLPVRHLCEAPGCGEGCVAQASLEALQANATVLNPRKLSLRVLLGEEVALWRPQSWELSADLQGDAGEGLQCARTAQSCPLLAAVTERRVTFTEDLRLHGEAAAGSVLLRSDVEWQVEEVRVLPNRVMVRGTAALRVLTLTEGGGFAGTGSYALPFSQMLECPRAEPGDEAELTIVTAGLDCRLLSAEEGPRLSVDLVGSMAARLWRTQQLETVTDLYSTRYVTAFETEILSCETRTEPAERRADVRESIECPGAEAVCDWSWCGRAEREGPETVCRFWFRVLVRAEGCLRTVCRRVDVRLDWEGACCCGVRAENVRVTPEEGGLCLEFTAVCRGAEAARRPLTQVSACTLDPGRPLPRPEPGTLLLRAAGPEETLWSIAKQYGVPQDSLRAANKLAADAQAVPGQLIVVPFAG